MIQKDNNNNDNAVFNQELSLDELASTTGGDLGIIALPGGYKEGSRDEGIVKLICRSGVSRNHK